MLQFFTLIRLLYRFLKELQVGRLFVSATGTGVGKSYATLALIRSFAARGIRPGVCKPIETGVTKVPEDASLLLREAQRHNRAFDSLTPEQITAALFPLPAAPFCADTRHRLDRTHLFEKVEELQERCDVLLIEGAGGLMVPIEKEYFMIDLARDLGAFTLLVTPSKLGCINETLLSLEALRHRRMEHDWCVNLHEDVREFPSVTQPFYDAAFPGWWSLQEGVEAFVERFLQIEKHPTRKEKR